MNETAETPPIDINTMTHFLNDFWSQIFWCSTDGHGDTVLAVEYFGESEVSKFDISLTINDNIFGFQTK
jgi:hypothetical protein